MALISRITNYVLGYFNPRKTQQQRLKPHKSPAASNRTALKTAAAVKELRARRERKNQAPTEDGEDESASESYDSDKSESPSEPESSSPYNQTSFDGLSTAEEDAYDANESTLVMTERDYANEQLENKEVYDPEAHYKRIRELQEELAEKGWAGDAISLFVKLESRGKEPLLPKSWELEFETLPIGLFTPAGFPSHIGSVSEAGDFRASLALKELIKLAPRVRDAELAMDDDDQDSSRRTRTSPESVTKKAVAEYLKWAYADAKLNVSSPNNRKSLDAALGAGKCLPLLINVAGPRTMSGTELQAVTLDKLVKLGEQWKAAMANPRNGGYITELPTLYAIISTYTVFGFVAYDIDFVNEDGEPEQPFLKTIAIFDFSQMGYDVWNSLAIALLGIHVRNEMVDIRTDVQVLKGSEWGVVPDVDEDE